ncbi:MAG: hypothetical protein OXF88_23090 [Rhodobacteraceae bacterium]|nr:hypothetical protein [Paracoccaceae bacterium]MCY4139865.1 hypothetical protein [Paracoccaceae bacterium]
MRQVSSETIEWFGTACNGGALSRTALAHEFCERENWYNRVANLCLASARKLLPALAEKLGVRLPEAEALEFDPHARPASDFPNRSVSCSPRDLGALSLELVTAPEERRRWEAMIESHHPEGWARARPVPRVRRSGRDVLHLVRLQRACSFRAAIGPFFARHRQP